MSRRIAVIPPPAARLAAALALALALPGKAATAQQAPASATTAAAPAMPMAMDHALHDMAIPDSRPPAAATGTDAVATSTTKRRAAPPTSSATPHAGHAMPPADHARGDMAMPGGMDHGTHAARMASRRAPATDRARHAEHGALTTQDGSTGQGMDHMAMPGMEHGTHHGDASPSHDGMPGMSADDMDQAGHAVDMAGMAGMHGDGAGHADHHGQHAPAAQGRTTGHAMDGTTMDSMAMPGMHHGAIGHGEHPAGMAGMRMGRMQGGEAPADARSPDYSDGIGTSHMPGMDMQAPRVGRVLLDKLEAVHGRAGSGQAWDLQAWYGGDLDKVWLRSEGERRDGRIDDGDAELLWNHLVATYWSTQLGVRHDLGSGPSRTWAAFGVEGLAPYYVDLQATAYLGEGGRTAARVRAAWEMLFTQRLILTPELELNAYGKPDRARGLGRGIADASLGLRLRFELRREFAPYVGVSWVRRFGGTAERARAAGEPVFDTRLVAGFRLWF